MSNFKASDGCEIFYDVKGTGEPLVFVHGWSANSDIFAHQVEHFSKSYRVVVYDFRGHGRSDRRSEITEHNMTMERNATDLLELMDHLKIDKDPSGHRRGRSRASRPLRYEFGPTPEGLGPGAGLLPQAAGHGFCRGRKGDGRLR